MLISWQLVTYLIRLRAVAIIVRVDGDRISLRKEDVARKRIKRELSETAVAGERELRTAHLRH